FLHRIFPWTVRPARSSKDRARCAALTDAYVEATTVYMSINPHMMALRLLRASNISERLGESGGLTRAHANLAMFYGELGRHRTAERYADSALAMAERLSLPWHTAEANLSKSYVRMLRNDAEGSLAYAQRA